VVVLLHLLTGAHATPRRQLDDGGGGGEGDDTGGAGAGQNGEEEAAGVYLSDVDGRGGGVPEGASRELSQNAVAFAAAVFVRPSLW
jgi:hypothetical protein